MNSRVSAAVLTTYPCRTAAVSLTDTIAATCSLAGMRTFFRTEFNILA